MRSALIREMHTILGEDRDHDRLIRRSDEVVDYLSGVRKKLLAFEQEFKRERNSLFAEHLAEMMRELDRIAREAVVDIEKSATMMDPEDMAA